MYPAALVLVILPYEPKGKSAPVQHMVHIERSAEAINRDDFTENDA